MKISLQRPEKTMSNQKPRRIIRTYSSFPATEEEESSTLVPSVASSSSGSNAWHSDEEEHRGQHCCASVAVGSSPSYSFKQKVFVTVGVLALASVLLNLFHNGLPSPEEQDYFEDNTPLMSPRERLREFRQQQQIADTSRAMFLTDAHKFYKKAYHRIENKKFDYRHEDAGLKENCESTVLIVRHCEKGKVREHCDYLGFERSVYLATLFGDNYSQRWPAPSYIYALSPDGRKNKEKLNFREVETVGALAEKVNVTIDTRYNVNEVNDLSEDILALLKSGELCGKLTLISWKHSNIGHLANHLGCGPMQGCPYDYKGRDFDVVWQIKYIYNVPKHSTRHSLKKETEAEWRVFGSVQNEGFDPLAFSKLMGDYPKGGTSQGARWRQSAFDVPERKEGHHHHDSEKDVWPEDAQGIVDEAS